MLQTTRMPTTTLDEPLAEAIRAVSIPRADPADSFVLHAPLELMARIGLLPLVHREARPAAEAAIGRLVERYEATGPGVAEPRTSQCDEPAEVAARLDAALRAGDLDEVDALAAWLTTRTTNAQARHLLGESIVDSLAAAGHAPIGLHLLGRVGGGVLPPTLMRGPLRELARHPDWRIDWFRGVEISDRPESLAAAITAVPHLGRAGSDFIFPLMSQVERSGIAARLIGPTLTTHPDVVSARRTLTRAAAWSMIHDDPDQAPYGWSHCLTMAQAVMSLAGDGVQPRTAVAVAATFVAGLRAGHGTRPLGSLDDEAAGEALDDEAASEATCGGDRAAPSVEDLATFAALHDDAHLVKYTLACVYAAEDDPAWGPVYLRAAGSLADWWRAHP